ncbi:ABC transporter permease [Avibacterium gallinarum]|uniref:ABC-2 type transport system permease protein n=1 Tax=Avibacterium gallinarum TaxID=755 RepID=A0A379B127_AVIGA|nr:ABC transporter permease [Avibacterium gallinarum]POY44200.1 ABC transporter permease [Avibacterium gallinarum]TDP29272.1 ABC-2 type transport system permease protein [Avibacterium gallinarum]SUB28194.1 inner membrane transport permease YhhJ [Avibacterium gallinarum]
MLIAAMFKELRLLSRDLHGVAVLFIMPILFMLIMSAALSSEKELGNRGEILLLGTPNDPLNDGFFSALQQEELLVKQGDIAQLAAYQQDLQQEKFALIVVNPNQDKNALKEEQPLQLWLNPSVDRAWLLGVKGILQKHYSQQRLERYSKDNHIVLKNNQRNPMKQIQQEVNQALNKKFNEINTYLAQERWQEIYLNRQGETVNQPNAVQHSVPAWLIFGMFFIMIPLSNVMAMERQTNTLTRLRLARASSLQLILAKLVPYFFINQCQFIGMIALGYWVLPMLAMPAFSLNGEWWHYAVLSAAVSLSALGYGLFISVIARTTEQAVVLGGGGIIIMAAIGGIMVPTYVMPEIMQKIAQFSPMGWALTAFQQLLLNQATLMQIQPELWLLTGFGAAMLLIAVLVYAHQLKTQARF